MTSLSTQKAASVTNTPAVCITKQFKNDKRLMLLITVFILKLKRVYKKELTFYGGAKLRKNIHSLFDNFAEKFDVFSDTGKNVIKNLFFRKYCIIFAAVN